MFLPAQSHLASKSPAASKRKTRATFVPVCTRTGRLSERRDFNAYFTCACFFFTLSSLTLHPSAPCTHDIHFTLSYHLSFTVSVNVAFKPVNQKSIVSTSVPLYLIPLRPWGPFNVLSGLYTSTSVFPCRLPRHAQASLCPSPRSSRSQMTHTQCFK